VGGLQEAEGLRVGRFGLCSDTTGLIGFGDNGDVGIDDAYILVKLTGTYLLDQLITAIC